MLNSFFKKTSLSLDFPEEVLLNQQVITIKGKNSLYIQNFKCLKEYNSHTIKIVSKDFILIIRGKSLNIKEITEDYIHINGSITDIIFNNGEKNE